MKNLILTPSIIEKFEKYTTDYRFLVGIGYNSPFYTNLLSAHTLLSSAETLCYDAPESSAFNLTETLAQVGNIIEIVKEMLPLQCIEFMDEIAMAIKAAESTPAQSLTQAHKAEVATRNRVMELMEDKTKSLADENERLLKELQDLKAFAKEIPLT